MAYSDDLAVFTTAKSIAALYKNLLEALDLHYEEKGYYVTNDNPKLSIGLQQFFQHYNVLNAKFLAQHMGMNLSLLSQYARGKKPPSSKQSEKIMLGIQTIGK